MIQDPTVPTPTNGQAIPPTCPTRKKFFPTEHEALAFEERTRVSHDLARQYAFKCEECPGYHLSAQSPESYAMQQSRQLLPRPVAVEERRSQRGSAEEIADRRRQVRELVLSDLSIRQIAEKIGVSMPTIHNDISQMGGLKALRDPLSIPPLQTVEALDEREKLLNAEIAKITADRKALIAARAFKFLPCFEGKGVLIKKESNSLGLSLDDAYELVDKLTAYLGALGSGAAGCPTRQ
jgi:hypothetical protein